MDLGCVRVAVTNAETTLKIPPSVRECGATVSAQLPPLAIFLLLDDSCLPVLFLRVAMATSGRQKIYLPSTFRPLNGKSFVGFS